MTNNEPVIKVRKLKIAFGSKVVLDEIDLIESLQNSTFHKSSFLLYT